MEYRRRLLKILLNILIPLIVIFLVVWGLPKVLGYFIPFVIGGIIALIANPLVRFLERKIKLRRKYGTVLIIGAVIAVVVIAGYAVISWLVNEIMGFVMDLPSGMQSTGELINELVSRVLAFVGITPAAGDLTSSVGSVLSSLGDSLLEIVSNFSSNLGTWAMSVASTVAKSIPTIFVMVIITILSAYFFLAEKEMLGKMYREHMPRVIKKYVTLIRGNIKRLVGGYFLAQLKIMVIIAVVLAICFLILKIPFAVVWAILIAILDFLPVLGTGTVLIPWAVLEFVGSNIFLGVGLLVTWILTQGIHQAVQPKMVGDSMNLNPLATLFFLYIGFKVSGIGGMILAVPVGIIVIEFYKVGAFDSLLNALKELAQMVNEFRGVSVEQPETAVEPVQTEEPPAEEGSIKEDAGDGGESGETGADGSTASRRGFFNKRKRGKEK